MVLQFLAGEESLLGWPQWKMESHAVMAFTVGSSRNSLPRSQDPEALPHNFPPLRDVMQDAKDDHEIFAGICEVTQIGGVHREELGVRQLRFFAKSIISGIRSMPT